VLERAHVTSGFEKGAAVVFVFAHQYS
jgi:hypothetical protein